MRRPNFPAMIRAQVEVTAQLGQAMALLSPDLVDGAMPEVSDAAYEFANARLQRARTELDKFEAATRGEAR